MQRINESTLIFTLKKPRFCSTNEFTITFFIEEMPIDPQSYFLFANQLKKKGITCFDIIKVFSNEEIIDLKFFGQECLRFIKLLGNLNDNSYIYTIDLKQIQNQFIPITCEFNFFEKQIENNLIFENIFKEIFLALELYDFLNLCTKKN